MSNATLYNKPGTPFYKTAQRMQATIQPSLEELVSWRHQHPHSDDPEASLGDFELPLETLRLLVAREEIQDAMSLILETDSLTSLFDYELGRIKPPPPPPPPKPKPSKKKGAKAPKVAEPGALDVTPGFRAPRTRRALAAVAAFEAEAAGGVAAEQVQEAQEVQEAGAAEAPKKPSKARPTGQPELVEDVDSQGSFKMFDAGWILPRGQKRHGRQAVERYTLPPPKKRMRTGAYRGIFRFTTGLAFIQGERGTSNLSTTASESQTIHATVPPEEVAGPSGLTVEEKAEVDASMDVEEPEREPSVALPIPALEPAAEPAPEPVYQPIPETIPEAVPAPVGQPISEPVPEPVSQPVPDTVVAPVGQPISEPVPEPVPDTAPVGQPISEPIPEPVSQPVPELAPELVPEPVSELDLEAVAEPEPAPAPEVHEETQAELQARIAAIPRDRYTNIFAMNGKIIIEELDTPATRREKASRRKAEKAAAAAVQLQAQPAIHERGDGHDSDLSSLSELESDEEGGGKAGPKERPVKVPPSAPPIAGPSTAPQPAGPGEVVLPEGKTLEGGTLGKFCHVIG